ncbi:GDSL-like Lipase/Acylhydrolase family protein [Chitinophaga sp. CF118]|uniref:SGNH/GDSL hydrolase family protein n=1 Tax=Chitinophaga sp. CF118 TaxID=1884367 RepID=UPI0008E1B997|nr:SGNH/GDSL hydrolase family protein [Chitinophaga sp. CF118]SFD62317.1 GDSL-like Lipase/Acylhydrolase family protein [Chitinophaga sp. CF118]
MQRLYFIFLLFAVVTCKAQQPVIKSDDPHIHYMGRVALKAAAAELSWSGTSVKINFSGTGVKATLKDERGENSYNVIVDNKVVGIIHPDTTTQVYTLVKGLPAGKHSLELYKRTEWGMGKTWFYQFSLDDNSRILPAPAVKKRKIEFYGNSITCGYAVEDTTGQDRGTAPYENGYISYAAITARHYDAEFSSISKSGIGVLVSWFPLIMPEMYDRLDPMDSSSKWDFSKYTPDVVVINLFQNDSWIVLKPEHAEFKARFGDKAPGPDQIIAAYRKLVESIRAKYPKASIICALGSMDAARKEAPWFGYIEKAVAGLKDKRIYTHSFGYKNTGGHPSAAEQAAMAKDLIRFIDQKIKW